MDPIAPHVSAPLPAATDKGTDVSALREAARELEATFLAEMLKYAGLGTMPDAFGGGAGEEQFSSFLRLEQAKEMTKAGGIGLAETLFEAMKEQADGSL